jgi:hypothetical protein
MWTLDIAVTDGDKTDVIGMDLTKYDGWGMDGAVLSRTAICECGEQVFFPDFAAPGAMISLEPLED